MHYPSLIDCSAVEYILGFWLFCNVVVAATYCGAGRILKRLLSFGRRLPLLMQIALLSVALGGCAQWQAIEQKVSTVVSAVSGATVNPQAVLVASNIFDGLEVTATNYLRLATCNGTTPVCRDPAATKEIIPAVRSGRVARNNLQQFFRDHPGQLGPQGLYDALQTSIATLQAAYAKYQIGGAS